MSTIILFSLMAAIAGIIMGLQHLKCKKLEQQNDILTFVNEEQRYTLISINEDLDVALGRATKHGLDARPMEDSDKYTKFNGKWYLKEK